MVSVVRLLPRHKIVRNGVPYTRLLGWVLNARVFNLLKFLAFVSVPLVFSQRLSLGTGFIYSYLCFQASLLIVLVARKLRIGIVAPVYASAAQEVVAKLAKPAYLALGASYSLSALIYIWLFAAGPNGLFETIKVDLPPTPPGLPRNLDSRPYGNLRVVNQDYCFRHYFALYAGFVYAAYHTLFKFDILESKLRVEAPWRRIEAVAKPTLVSGVLASLLIVGTWPLVYLITHNRIFKIYTIWGLQVQGQTPPPSLASILGASYHFFGLILAWQIVNSAFTIYMSLGPFHRGHTISSPSQDPNGSLISGLQHRSGSLTELTAWQELLFISQRDEQRRKAIFKDVDSDRVVWKLVHGEYTRVVNTTIEALDKSSTPVKAPAPEKPRDTLDFGNTSTSCLFTRPTGATTVSTLKSEFKDVFVRARISPSARLLGKMQDPSSAKSQKAARWLGVAIPDVQKPLVAWIHAQRRKFLLSAIGRPFRTTSSRESQALIPANGVLTLALESVAQLIVASHDEDPFGYVQVDIAATLAQLDRLIALLDKAINRDKSQWLDLAVQQDQEAVHCETLTLVRMTAANAFDAISAQFGAYFDDLKVSDSVKARASVL